MTNHRSHLVGAALISTLCSTHAFVVRDAPMTKSAPSPGPALLNKIKDTTKIGDLVVPNVGIGTIAWSPKESTLDDLELQNLVSEACQSNAAFFDTGERYGPHKKSMFGLGWGETETFLSDMIRTSRPEEFGNGAVVATKFTPSPGRSTAQSVVDACEKSRERLGVDQIDLYQIHMPDIVKPLRFLGLDQCHDEAYWDGIAECYHRGIVKNVGVSNYGPTLVTRCHEALAKRGVPLASNQIAYSLIGRHNGAQETVDRCAELGVKVLAYYPYAMGLLTGKYSSEGSYSKTEEELTSLTGSRRSKFELSDLEKYSMGDGGETVPDGGIAPVLRVMEDIASRRTKTVAQVALNYVISKGAIPIPGARTAAQVRDNIGALGWRLSDKEVAMLEAEADQLGFGFDGAGFKKTSEKFVGYGMEKWRLD